MLAASSSPTSTPSPAVGPISMDAVCLPPVDAFRRLSCERKVDVYAQAVEEIRRLYEALPVCSPSIEVEGLKRAVAQLQADRDRHEHDAAERKAELAGVKKAIDAQKDALKTLKANSIDESEFEVLESDIDKHDAILSELKADVARQRADIEELQAQLKKSVSKK